MGNKYTIMAWGKHDDMWDPWANDKGYSNKEMWRGQFILAALYNLWKIKRRGFGCVTLECR